MTAVEYLVDQFKVYVDMKIHSKEINQAKEMERHQIIDAHGNKTISINQDQSKLITGEQYYNETYK